MLLEKTLAKFGIKPGLERMEKLMSALGNPQEKYQVILITGTNGKGSTTSFLASILKEAGHTVGSYFSPHIFKYNERFKVNGKDISDKDLKKYEKKLLSLYKKGYEMTLFEALTAIAYLYFADKNVDYAVMEIGMGGTYDATNIAKEVAAIITNVELEHTEYLGNSIEEIAKDKAGIIKTASLVATAAGGAALSEIRKVAGKIQLDILNDSIFVNTVKTTADSTVFTYLGTGVYHNLEVKLLGDYQAKNAALAIAIAESVSFDVDEKAIRKGLLKARNPCRIEVIGKKPLIIADAAHNVAGIGSLISNLHLFSFDRLICVFGCLKTKNWKEMLHLLAPHCDELIVTSVPHNPSSADPKELAKYATSYTKTQAITDVKKAVKEAKKKAKKNDLILICGSIYMLGEAIKVVKKK